MGQLKTLFSFTTSFSLSPSYLLEKDTVFFTQEIKKKQ